MTQTPHTRKHGAAWKNMHALAVRPSQRAKCLTIKQLPPLPLNSLTINELQCFWRFPIVRFPIVRFPMCDFRCAISDVRLPVIARRNDEAIQSYELQVTSYFIQHRDAEGTEFHRESLASQCLVSQSLTSHISQSHISHLTSHISQSHISNYKQHIFINN